MTDRAEPGLRERIAALRPWPDGERLIQSLERLADRTLAAPLPDEELAAKRPSSPIQWEWYEYGLLEGRAALRAERAALARVETAAREVVAQLGTRYDDQWAVGSVLLPDLDALRAALAPATGEGAE